MYPYIPFRPSSRTTSAIPLRQSISGRAGLVVSECGSNAEKRRSIPVQSTQTAEIGVDSSTWRSTRCSKAETKESEPLWKSVAGRRGQFARETGLVSVG